MDSQLWLSSQSIQYHMINWPTQSHRHTRPSWFSLSTLTTLWSRVLTVDLHALVKFRSHATVYCGGSCEYRVYFVGPHTVNLKLDIQYVPLLVCNCLGTYGCKLVLRVYFFLFVCSTVVRQPRGPDGTKGFVARRSNEQWQYYTQEPEFKCRTQHLLICITLISIVICCAWQSCAEEYMGNILTCTRTMSQLQPLWLVASFPGAPMKVWEWSLQNVCV